MPDPVGDQHNFTESGRGLHHYVTLSEPVGD